MAQYDPTTKTGCLFRSYIDLFLKRKQEVADYYEHEGIQLEPANIARNSPSETDAQQLLGQTRTEEQHDAGGVLHRRREVLRGGFDLTRIVHGINYVNENMVAVSYTFEDEFAETLSNTNVVIAAYTTAQARLKLYSYIEELQERVLYFNTDSLVFLAKVGDWMPELGSYLGYMSNELRDYGPDAYIEEFQSVGRITTRRKLREAEKKKAAVTVIVRGIRLDSTVQKSLNFNSMRHILFPFFMNNCQKDFSIVTQRIELTVEKL